MNILITGSEGFIGKHLCKYFQQHNIIHIDRKLGKEVLDINNLDNIDVVIHLASQTSVWNKDVMLIENDNVKSFIHLFELCKKENKKLIWTSSSCSINTTSMYGLSKRFCEEYQKLYNYDNVVCLRLHNVYGSNPREDTLLGKCMNNNEVVLYNKGQNKRHFTYIEDVYKCFEKAFNLTGFYNVLNPIINTTEEFVQEIIKFKPIDIIMSDEVRDKDTIIQKVEDIPNLLINPTNIQEGISKIFK